MYREFKIFNVYIYIWTEKSAMDKFVESFSRNHIGVSFRYIVIDIIF